MSADILERLRALSRCEHSDLSIGDEAAAEIVRLRGEVAVTKTLLCQVYTDAYYCGHHDTVEGQYTDVLPVDRDTYWLEQVTDYIAPAEAKGDVLREMFGKGDAMVPPNWADYWDDTPQPAGGEAAAWMRPEDIAHLAKQNGVAHVLAWNCANGDEFVPVYTTPPAAQGSEVSRMDAIVAAYNTWPDDLRKKLSIHDLRRMTGWTPPAAQVQQEAVPVGLLDLSAPPRVFLQVDTDGDDEDRSEAIPREAWEDLTWHHARIGGQEVEYIRVDLANATHPADRDKVRVTDEMANAACIAYAESADPHLSHPSPPHMRAALEAALAQPQEVGREVKHSSASACTWSFDSDPAISAYATSCGGLFTIIDGTPSDNGMKHCCYCGHIIHDDTPEATDHD